ncbi:hypothetical protein [Parasitella parasitica]|uniref:Uncharacterized protein n=1 Tax=Parasitella parasitica TaxID=35722 RepID=A0A0B7NP95_9FUNG|nr:hypothetical protein [Parasitella parasitica]
MARQVQTNETDGLTSSLIYGHGMCQANSKLGSLKVDKAHTLGSQSDKLDSWNQSFNNIGTQRTDNQSGAITNPRNSRHIRQSVKMYYRTFIHIYSTGTISTIVEITLKMTVNFAPFALNVYKVQFNVLQLM